MIVVVELDAADAARLCVLGEILGASPDACARGLIVARLEGLVEQIAEAFVDKGDPDAG